MIYKNKPQLIIIFLFVFLFNGQSFAKSSSVLNEIVYGLSTPTPKNLKKFINHNAFLFSAMLKLIDTPQNTEKFIEHICIEDEFILYKNEKVFGLEELKPENTKIECKSNNNKIEVVSRYRKITTLVEKNLPYSVRTGTMLIEEIKKYTDNDVYFLFRESRKFYKKISKEDILKHSDCKETGSIFKRNLNLTCKDSFKKNDGYEYVYFSTLQIINNRWVFNDEFQISKK
jgi:hypothetical protein